MTRQQAWVEIAVASLGRGEAPDTAIEIADKLLLGVFDKRFPPTAELENLANEMWMEDCDAAVKGLVVTIPCGETTGNPVVDVIRSMKSVLMQCKNALDPSAITIDSIEQIQQAIKELGL